MRLGEGKAALAARTRVKKEREGNRWSLEQMAEKLRAEGIHQARATTVHKIESGERRISLDELAAYANIFRMGVADLLLDRQARIKDLHRRFTDQVDTCVLDTFVLMNICEEADGVLGDNHNLLVLAHEAVERVDEAYELLNTRFAQAFDPLVNLESGHRRSP